MNKKAKKNSNSVQENIPDDLIRPILSKLPVKSLVKFKSVSKSWHSLISCKQFAKSHLEESAKNPNLVHHSTISIDLIESGNRLKIKQCPVGSLLYGKSTNVVEFDYNLAKKINSITLAAGCCNGLWCLLGDERFILWNPSTRQHKELPRSIANFRPAPRMSHYGFGYDEPNDDYKVFVSFYSSRAGFGSVTKLYSLKTNKWGIVEDDFICNDNDGKCVGVSVNGKLHWVSGYIDLEITTFDLVNQASGVVQLPLGCASTKLYPALCVLEGCLSCLLGNKQTNSLDIWIFKRCGVEETWCKLSSILCQNRELEMWGIVDGPFWPLYIAPEGTILVVRGPVHHNNCYLQIYDPKNNCFRLLQTDREAVFFTVHVYIQSLISPFG